MSEANDRRQHPRITSQRVGFISVGETNGQAQMCDIAAGGVCFEVNFAVEPGQQTLIELGPGRLDVQEPVHLPARIVWCTRRSGHFQVGAKFEALDARQLERLGLLLADLAGDTPRSYRRPLTRVTPEDQYPDDD